MRHNGHWRPGRRIGFRLFGFVFFLVFVAAVIGGLISWLATPGRFWFLVVGVLVVVVFVATMARVFRRGWLPLSELIDATTALGEGDTATRMSTGQNQGPWGAVGRSFNRMAQRLEDEDERRRRLLGDLSHELRTPLTVIRGEIEAVLDGVHGADSLHNVIDEVELMDRLLDDLGTAVLAEAGTLELRAEPTDLRELAEEVAASFRALAGAKDISLEVVGPETGEVSVDPHRIHQVVSNLVANALRETPEGGTITIEAGRNALSVTDTGPGIEPGDMETIFDRFVKAADSSGSGLGLSIARDLIEAHGGRMWAENEPNGGARFSFVLDNDVDPAASRSSKQA